MVKGIPPKTMLEILKKERPEAAEAKKKGQKKKKEFGVKVFKKPREWLYETKPVFKKIRGPLVDVFKEAEEVRIVIDLSGFKLGEVDIDIKPDRYIIKAFKQERTFREEVLFPKDVDTDNIEERFRNGILELVLPRKKPVGAEDGGAEAEESK